MNSISPTTNSIVTNTENYHSRTNETEWARFYKLATLSISFAHNTATTANIYGNGRNQVAVVINLKATDTAGNSLNLTADDIYNAIYLCDYNTGEKIESYPNIQPQPRSSSYWSYSRYENDYHNAISFQSASISLSGEPAPVSPQALASDIVTLTLYITCAQVSDGQLFSVGLNVPGVGDFDTSRNGTSTLNGPAGASGSVFKSPSYVNIIARQAINYSDRSNITIEYGGTVVLSESQHYTSRILASSYDHYDGIARRKIVSLKSAHGYSFLSHGIAMFPLAPKSRPRVLSATGTRPG